nr:MAG TPA: hypothetical protein [Caudoviricetes sp.]
MLKSVLDNSLLTLDRFFKAFTVDEKPLAFCTELRLLRAALKEESFWLSTFKPERAELIFVS